MRAPLLVCLLAAGPAVAQPACPLAGQAPHLLVRLYFGQSVTGGAPVSRRAWDRFVAEQVAAAFPDDFTVLDAAGGFRDRGGAVSREATEVVEVAAPDTPDLHARVAALAESYKRRFAQRAVGVVTQPVCAAF